MCLFSLLLLSQKILKWQTNKINECETWVFFFFTVKWPLLAINSLLSYDSFSRRGKKRGRMLKCGSYSGLHDAQILTTNSDHTELRVCASHTAVFSPASVFVLRFIRRLSSNLLCALLAVRMSLLEIMLKQYCPSVRVINHRLDKSSGHCWRVMSALLTFNALGLLLVRWIIGPALLKVEHKFCVMTWCNRHCWAYIYFDGKEY